MKLEDAIGLHTTLEVWYVVDGYSAVIIDDVTGTRLAEGDVYQSVLAAIGSLGMKLQGATALTPPLDTNARAPRSPGRDEPLPQVFRAATDLALQVLDGRGQIVTELNCRIELPEDLRAAIQTVLEAAGEHSDEGSPGWYRQSDVLSAACHTVREWLEASRAPVTASAKRETGA
jgi:hypothetical protein